MSSRYASISASLMMACLVAACGGEVGDTSTDATIAALSDPCTGESVGQLDRELDTMTFDDGFEVKRSEVERLSEQDAPALQCNADAAGDSEGMRTRSAWANGRCWHFAESYVGGYASCQGCCTPVGGGAYYCWESCIDSMHTFARRGRAQPMGMRDLLTDNHLAKVWSSGFKDRENARSRAPQNSFSKSRLY